MPQPTKEELRVAGFSETEIADYFTPELLEAGFTPQEVADEFGLATLNGEAPLPEALPPQPVFPMQPVQSMSGPPPAGMPVADFMGLDFNPKLTLWRLLSQAGRSAGQGLKAIPTLMRAFEETRDIGTEVGLPTIHTDPRMGLLQTPEGKPFFAATRGEKKEILETRRAEDVGRYKAWESAFPDMLPGSSGLTEEVVTGVSRFIAGMGVTMANPLAGTAVLFAQIAGTKYGQYEAEGKTKTQPEKEKALLVSTLTAMAQTPIEQAGNLLQIGAWKNLARSLLKGGKGTRLAAFLEALVKGGIGEGGEELLQQPIDEIADIVMNNPDMSAGELVAEVWKNKEKIAKRSLGAGGVGVLGGIGMAGLVGTAAIPVQAKDYLADKEIRKEIEALGQKTGGEAGIFGGEKARTAEQLPLFRAKKLAMEGERPDTIRKKTGWFMGPDDKWRFEIDDSKMSPKRRYGKGWGWVDNFSIDKEQKTTLGEMLDHKDLFEAYPWLADIVVEIKKGLIEEGVVTRDGRILIRAKGSRYGPSLKAFKETLAHEVQHLVQEHEGHALGSSPRAEAINIVNRETRWLEDNNETYRNLLRDVDRLDFEGTETLRQQVERDHLRDAMELIFQDHLESKYEGSLSEVAFEEYKRVAGEVESEDTSGRLELDADGRAVKPPRFVEGVPDAIVRLGGDEALRETTQHWHSQMEKFLSSKLAGKGTGESYAKTIKAWAGKGQIKAEELEWSGLNEWLEGQEAVTKQEVLDWLAENNVRVEEVVKGEVDEGIVEAWWTDEGGANEETPYGELSESEQADAKRRYQDEAGDYDEGATKYSGSAYTTPGVEDYQEIVLWSESAEPMADDPVHFVEGHEGKRQIAWVRFGTNYIDGKKNLHIDEVQSKRHQAGRKEGYKGSQYGRVPDAPFKKTWPLLAMKRMVRYAAENGYDSISWTPGDVQADRYDLSKQVSKVVWLEHASALKAYGHSGDEVVSKIATKDQLADHLGKEVAERLLASSSREYTFGPNQAKGVEYTLKGEDLKIGGEGMKGFYDKILPSAVNKFFNKAAWGNAKVSVAEIPTTVKGEYDRFELLDGDGNVVETAQTEFIANSVARERGLIVRDTGKAQRKKQEVWHLPITPKMRQKALYEGMPQFSFGGKKPPMTDAEEIADARKRMARGSLLENSPEYKRLAEKHGAKLHGNNVWHDKGTQFFVAEKIKYGRPRAGDKKSIVKATHPIEGKREVEVWHDKDGTEIIDGPILSHDAKKRHQEIDKIYKEGKAYSKWYREWRDFARSLQGGGYSGVEFDRRIRIMAELSAGASPASNMKKYARVMSRIESGVRVKGGPGTGISATDAKKIMAIWDSRVNPETLGELQATYGMKVGAYMATALDPAHPDAVVNDRHIGRIFGFNFGWKAPGKKKGPNFYVPAEVQKFIEKEIRKAAKRLGVPPAEVQAPLWFAARPEGAQLGSYADAGRADPGNRLSLQELGGTFVDEGFAGTGTHFTKPPSGVQKSPLPPGENDKIFDGFFDSRKSKVPYNPWSRKDWETASESETDRYRRVPFTNFYGPGVSPEKALANLPERMSVKLENIYDAGKDSLGYWSRAAEVWEKEKAAGRNKQPNGWPVRSDAAAVSNIAIGLIKKSKAYKGVSRDMATGTWFAMFDPTPVASPTIQVDVAVSSVVESVEKVSQDAKELAKTAAPRHSRVSPIVEGVVAKYPGLRYEIGRPTTARFKEETSNKLEPGSAITLSGPLQHARAAAAELGLSLHQNYVYLIHTFDLDGKHPANGDLVEWRVDSSLKEEDLFKISGDLGLNDVNIVQGKGGSLSIKQFVGEWESPETVKNFGEFRTKTIAKGANSYSHPAHTEPWNLFSAPSWKELGDQAYDYHIALHDYWGKTKGQEVYNAARKRGQEYKAQLQKGPDGGFGGRAPGSETTKGSVVGTDAVATYSDAPGKGNVWIKQAKGPGSASNKNRVLFVQVSSKLQTWDTPDDVGQPYFDKLYSEREGYKRPNDFWELPEWIGQGAKTFPNADVYVVRDIAEAKKFLAQAGYDKVMMSVMSDQQPMIEDLIDGYKGDVILGGYVPADSFKQKNVKFLDSIKAAAKEAGVPYVEGADYRHFAGTRTMPRLNMSEGCRHTCKFCTIPNKVTESSPENIASQIEAFKDLKFDLVYLNDKTFGQAENHTDLLRLKDEILAYNPDFKGFVIQTTAPQFLKFSDAFLAESGIKFVELGVESYNDKILKGVSKPAREKHIDAAAEKMREHDILFIPNLMVGLSGRAADGTFWTETAETYKHTLGFLRANKDIISHVNINNLALYEGTDITEEIVNATAMDLNQNATERSWHEDPKVHSDFYRDATEFGSKMLDKDVVLGGLETDGGGVPTLPGPGSRAVALLKNEKGMVDFQFKNKEIEKRYKASQGAQAPSLGEKTMDVLIGLKNKASREFEHLPKTKEFAQLSFDLRKLAKQKGVSSDKVLRALHSISEDLNPESYNLFARYVLLDDLIETAMRGESLPLGFRKKSLAEEVKYLNEAVHNDPSVKEAVKKRNKVWAEIKDTYVKAMQDIGFDVSGRFSRKAYFRHQVLDYVRTQGLFGAGRKLKTPSARGFLKKRAGSELDINTDYIQAEHEVMAQMVYDIEVAKTIKAVDNNYNIIDRLRKEAKATNKANEGKNVAPVKWEDLIPKGYRLWQPREGTTFYMVDSVPAKLAEQLRDGVFDEIGLTAADLKRVMAVGGSRKSFVLKEEVADTLDELVKIRTENPVIAGRRHMIRAWKILMLVAPRRWAKYNTRNMTGDADAAFVGNPSGFKKVPGAVKELFDVYFRNKPMSENLQDWFERGGMETTLQAAEMGDLNELKLFVNLTKKKTKLTRIPTKVWQGYWKAARLTTDFREAIMRYSNYLSYLEQMGASPDGMPKEFGASDPEEVRGLKDLKDRAFLLSNDLLGAYDRVSVMGQALRENVIPFWSWNEVNFKRYIQFAKNAVNDGKLAQKVGRKAIGVVGRSPFVAYRVGKFMIKATAFWSMLQVWNHMIFPDEEEELPENVRTRPHIILSKNDDGTVNYFSRMGTLGDFLEWFGLDAAPEYIDKLYSGEMGIADVAKEMALSAPKKVISGAAPMAKLAGELLTRSALFPDPFSPRVIRDKMEHFARALTLENEYKVIAGKPTRGYTKSLKRSLIYVSDPGQAAYGDIYVEKRKFMKSIGKYGEGFWLTPRGDKLYNFKLALRYKDNKAAGKYAREYTQLYLESGGDPERISKNIKAALLRMDPLSGMKTDEKLVFVASLSEDNRKRLVRAQQFYLETIAGGSQ